jgi:site-specific DNA-methyltransferase (adenine-specific)
MTSKVFNEDCMKGMARFPDRYFDLAVVDPPYGIGISSNPIRQKHDRKSWDDAIPKYEYFEELFRVSKNSIIWGGNYFPLPPSKGFIIWDKKQPENFSLAMCELAYSTIQSPAKIFRYSVLDGCEKIHPTQKPIKLYSWIFNKYLPEGGKVIDTHLGSGSSRIAAHRAGNIDFIGFELDLDYFLASDKRFKEQTAQQSIFA